MNKQIAKKNIEAAKYWLENRSILPSDNIRIPFRFMNVVVNEFNSKNEWCFETDGGNIVVALKNSCDGIDWIINPND